MSKLCVSLTETTASDMLDAMRELPPQVDVAEIRMDYLKGGYQEVISALHMICRRRDRRIIITNRPVREGGRWAGDESQRLAVLEEAAQSGADYIDIEWESLTDMDVSGVSCRKIVSYHNFEETPRDLAGIYNKCKENGADVVKIAAMARDICDSARMLNFLQEHSKLAPPLIALCMGEEGIATRVLAPKFGGFLSFASQSREKQSAPGQIGCENMLNMYQFHKISPSTKIYGVVANPVSHSMSPAIHNTAFKHERLDAVYLPFKVKDPEPFLNSFLSLGLKGLSVTIPHKEKMMALVDDMDDMSKKIGALNTINILSGRKHGFNTDISAAMRVLKSTIKNTDTKALSRCKVLLLGAGGAARAIAYGLCGTAEDLIIANRTDERAVKLAQEINARYCSMDEMPDCRPDIIINTTSVGMSPKTNAMPVPPQMLEHRPLIFDAIYNPVETRLLREAKKAGCATAYGFDWFIDQAVQQFEIWTERKAPTKIMADVVRNKLAVV